jgi:hypothetical protein
MVLSLEEAVAIFSKWKDDSAQILVVSENPDPQSRRGVLERGTFDWNLGLHGKVAKISIDGNISGKKAGTVTLQGASGTLSLSIGHCAFTYQEPKEAELVVREEAEAMTVSSLAVFFPSSEVFVFYELPEALRETK